MDSIYSTQEQLKTISKILMGYLKLPFSGDAIPGALMESIVSEVKSGQVLNTYDFIDILNQSDKAGWQVKSTQTLKYHLAMR